MCLPDRALQHRPTTADLQCGRAGCDSKPILLHCARHFRTDHLGIADVLNKITDKQIRIEGHTDNVPISSKLQDRFKTNWELSTARATTVVRYLIDHGGVDRQYLSAVGYADTHPLASNDTEEGRSSNRRIDIVLYPKDLKEIAGEVETSTAGSK